MTKNTEVLLKDAMTLPEAERAELAARLVESLEPNPEADVEAAWHAEIGRRLERIDSGQAKFVSWPELRDRLRARLSGGA
jgi:putative addiction module component (TIGR02574 family)